MHPVLVPKSLEQSGVQSALKERMIKLVVLVRMQAEFIKFLAGNDSTTRLLFIVLENLFSMVVLISSETSNLYFASGDRSLWIYNDSD